MLKLRVHQDEVRHCQYSVDGTKVLSCASQEVKVGALTMINTLCMVHRVTVVTLCVC